MLGILLMAQEVVNYYDANTDQDPQYATPVNIDRYLSTATKGFEYLPAAFHPVSIFLERLENKAKVDPRTGILLKTALYPALEGHFVTPHNYSGKTPANDTSPAASGNDLKHG